MTDELPVYRTAANGFAAHHSVQHGAKEYVRGEASTNSVESSFALLKRGLIGTFHAVSKKHLHRYVGEFDFRWNARTMNDGDRIALAIKAADGKRLLYRQPVTKAG
jgi:hypothetical protein